MPHTPFPLHRRQFMLGGAACAANSALWLTGCQPTAHNLPQRLAHVSGGFAGQSVARGHALRDATAGGPKSGSATPPAVVRRVHTLIAGGGVAGLAAARALRLRGQDDFCLLELEDEAGGNARGGVLGGLPCPLGAHYLPVPGDHNPDLQHLLEEQGLRRREARRWVYDERALCHSPQERLYFNGRWQAGLLPTEGVGPDTLAQYSRFAALVAGAQRAAAAHVSYQIPHHFYGQNSQLSLDIKALDAQFFSNYLQRNGLTDPLLLAHLDYCCRDDYGAGLDQVSAWAGIHYFAGRHGFVVPGDGGGVGASLGEAGDEREAVLTWPEGNAWLTRRLAQPLGDRLHTGCVVQRINVGKHGVQVDAFNARSGQLERWLAQRCVVALPIGVAARVLDQPPAPLQVAAQRVRYAPWVVANLHLSQPLADRGGAAPAWDNVVHGSTGLGYVNATHQALYRAPDAPTVLTHYRALGLAPGARAHLLAQPWAHWLQAAVADLLPAHPELPERITSASVARHGHAMAVPTPGFLQHLAPIRAAIGEASFLKNERVTFAHSDWAGYSVFEEAFAMGHAAGGWAA